MHVNTVIRGNFNYTWKSYNISLQNATYYGTHSRLQRRKIHCLASKYACTKSNYYHCNDLRIIEAYGVTRCKKSPSQWSMNTFKLQNVSKYTHICKIIAKTHQLTKEYSKIVTRVSLDRSEAWAPREDNTRIHKYLTLEIYEFEDKMGSFYTLSSSNFFILLFRKRIYINSFTNNSTRIKQDVALDCRLWKTDIVLPTHEPIFNTQLTYRLQHLYNSGA